MKQDNVVEPLPTVSSVFNVEQVRRDFPILERRVHGKPLVYLDNAATSQKPRQVLEVLDNYYRSYNSNIHRGVHALSEQATAAYEDARGAVRKFINARSDREIIFVRGTTEAINLVAQSYGRRLQSGDEILITAMEHHANIVPWQMLCEQTGARLEVAPINDRGELIMEEFERRLRPSTRIVAIAHISNALGTVNPVEEIVRLAKAREAVTVLDGAQAVPHAVVDVQALGCDFYAFSGHKMFGPTGIGVLYGREALLEQMPPYQGGGDMIKMVTFEKTVYNDLPHKFEAGTPHIAGAIGLGAAVQYLSGVGLASISRYEHELLEYGTAVLTGIEGLRLVGTASQKAAVLSFIIDGIHPHDLGTILDMEGVAIRTGHHCAMPVMDRFKIPATARASLAFYNTRGEIDALARAIEDAKKVFA